MLQKAKRSDAGEGAEVEQEEEDGEAAMEQDEDDEKPLVAMVGLHNSTAPTLPCCGRTCMCICCAPKSLVAVQQHSGSLEWISVKLSGDVGTYTCIQVPSICWNIGKLLL